MHKNKKKEMYQYMFHTKKKKWGDVNMFFVEIQAVLAFHLSISTAVFGTSFVNWMTEQSLPK